VPPRDWRDRVRDILEAITRIEHYSRKHDQSSFIADGMAVDAVIRNVAVIGEAANHIPAQVQQRHPDVPWAQMRGMRNVLVHEYFEIGLDLLWATIQNDLPVLKERLREVLAAETD
jgi:uncharacterized protein with HEPN domain